MKLEKFAYRHTTSHVLAEAIKNLYPDVKLAIGPSVDNGFYYDFDSEPFSREDLDKIEAEMKKSLRKVPNLKDLHFQEKMQSSIWKTEMSHIR